MFIVVHHAQYPPEHEASDALGHDWLELTLPGPPMICTSRACHVTHTSSLHGF